VSNDICRTTNITRAADSAALLLGARSFQGRQWQLSTNTVCESLRALCPRTSAEQQKLEARSCQGRQQQHKAVCECLRALCPKTSAKQHTPKTDITKGGNSAALLLGAGSCLGPCRRKAAAAQHRHSLRISARFVSRDTCRTADITKGGNSAALLLGAKTCQGRQQHKAVCESLRALCSEQPQSNRHHKRSQQRSTVVGSRKLPGKAAAAQSCPRISACFVSKDNRRTIDITRAADSAALLLEAGRQTSTNTKLPGACACAAAVAGMHSP
jgi:hypothetical protein